MPSARLRPVAGEQFGEQVPQRLLLGSCETVNKFILDRIRVQLQFCEVSCASGGEGDDVPAAIRGIGAAGDVLGSFEPAQDAVHVIAVQAEVPTDVGLAEGPVLVE